MNTFYITPTDYETAKHNGINARLATDRVRTLGWNIERAITSKPRQTTDKRKWTDLAKLNNISRGAFYGRVARGMSMDQASTTPVMDKKTLINNIAIAKRKYPKEYEDMAVANGINKNAFVSRMKRKWNVLDAATRPMKE